LEGLEENRFVFPATAENIQYAKKFIQDLISESSKITPLVMNGVVNSIIFKTCKKFELLHGP